MEGWMDGSMDEWMDRWMNGWMHVDGWIDGWMDTLLHSNCVPRVQAELLQKLKKLREELPKKLRGAIKKKDEDSLHRHLSGLDELLQDDKMMKELLDDSLAYAAYTGFQPAVKTLIQKGAGKKYSQ